MNEKETKFCNGTFECFGCPEQGEGNCYISGCPWVARFEEIKDKFAVAWFKREIGSPADIVGELDMIFSSDYGFGKDKIADQIKYPAVSTLIKKLVKMRNQIKDV